MAVGLDVLFDESELAFRDEVESFLEEEGTPEDPLQYFRGRGGSTRRLYEKLGERGWLSLCWPREFGGRELPPSYEFVLWDTLAYHRVARPDLGPGIVAYALRTHGTAEQRDHYLSLLRSGSACFALGYSEPTAGSDLGGLRTRATHVGDSYVVSGEKCWTSDAHHADYLWLLCRTGTTEDRSRGLTILVLDMSRAGVSVVPIPTIDGHRLNQVFLDEVEIPESERVGAEGGAWAIVRDALAVERHLQVLPGRLRRDLVELRHTLESRGMFTGAAADQWAALAAQTEMVHASALATVSALAAGHPAVAEAAQTKVLGSELAQEIPRVGLDLLGAGGIDGDASTLPFLWRQSIMETIAGGANDILLSLLARESFGISSHV